MNKVLPKVIMLAARQPSWPVDYKDNVLAWAKEGQEITITFSPDDLKYLLEYGMVIRVVQRTVEP